MLYICSTDYVDRLRLWLMKKIALDRRKIPRIHQIRISLVPRHIRQLPLPHPTRRRNPLLRARLLRWHLHRSRRWLQPTSRSPPLLPSVGAPYRAYGNLERCNGCRASTSLLPYCNRPTAKIQPQLGHALHNCNVQHRPALLVSDMEGVFEGCKAGGRACQDSDAG